MAVDTVVSMVGVGLGDAVVGHEEGREATANPQEALAVAGERQRLKEDATKNCPDGCNDNICPCSLFSFPYVYHGKS